MNEYLVPKFHQKKPGPGPVTSVRAVPGTALAHALCLTDVRLVTLSIRFLIVNKSFKRHSLPLITTMFCKTNGM